MDKPTADRIQLLHPTLRKDGILIYQDITKALTGRAQVRFTHTLRTIAEQNAIYAQGRTTPGKIVTRARGGASYHNYGLAIDICLIIDGKEASWDMDTDFDADKKADWMECVRVFEAHGWEWGASFKDYPHFQKTFGFTVGQLKTLPNVNGYPQIPTAL